MDVLELSTRHHEAQKTIPKIFDGPWTDARTKFRSGLEKVNCDERV